ncbi:3-hydroxyacyl-ACP dehydratase FabZ family protein [Croceivirga thetidis]|uniref:Hydroxymyristoyl-ACP dehydratase n=1 Tax=Croceivirga thetidis TaxID=2721623 RepID=A0ABX1GTN9_9FLAO|nr:hydroxymyristoyl-ACP dehydratase [Croceivirga thetidis]NKI32365.1 hydroxymyristoyl-ACP dehydratase [Croceivirga thetidis]
MSNEDIISRLPYSKPFLFVDELVSISEEGISGYYSFPKDSFFYKGHFKDNPITPGVILTECCAQIGLVALGICLLGDELVKDSVGVGMTSSEMEFLKPVVPEERVRVVSEKLYFRFNKLKCKVKMYNTNEELVCSGTLAGMLVNKEDEK